IVRGIGLPCLELLEDRRGSGPELLGKLLALPNVLIYLVPVVKVIGESSVDVREGDGRGLGDDLVRAHPHPLMPDGDISDRDAMPGDARLAAADPRCHDNAVSKASAIHRGGCLLALSLACRFHVPILSQRTPSGERLTSRNRYSFSQFASPCEM